MAHRVTRTVVQKWFPAEVFPILGIVGLACGGATFYLYRLSQGSEVVWDRHGDWRPWDKVKQDQNLKLMSVNKEFWEKRKSQYGGMQAEKRMVDSI